MKTCKIGIVYGIAVRDPGRDSFAIKIKPYSIRMFLAL